MISKYVNVSSLFIYYVFYLFVPEGHKIIKLAMLSRGLFIRRLIKKEATDQRGKGTRFLLIEILFLIKYTLDMVQRN